MEFGDRLRDELAREVARFDRRAVPADGRRTAAVLLAITAGDDGAATFVLTRRVGTLRDHGGEWALPGGRLDDGEDAIDAARRELLEELGIALTDESVLGLLDDYPTRSGFVITPVVAWLADPWAPIPNPSEVASVHRIPLAELGHPSNPRLLSISESARPVLQLRIGEGAH